MSFLKGVKGTIDIAVKASIPALNEKDEDIVLEVPFIVTYKRFKRKEARLVLQKVMDLGKEAQDAFTDGDLSHVSARLEYFDDLLRENVRTWRNMPGSDGEQVPFSQEALAEAIDDSYYCEALMKGLRRALGWSDSSAAGSGGEEAKNS